jgi:hypothetical protein
MPERRIPVPSAEAKQRPKKDCRVWVRFPPSLENCCHPVAACTARDSDTHWFGKIRDISIGGLALAMSRCFEAGSLLILDLDVQAVERSFFVQVVHATPEGNGHWIMGCKFMCPLREEDLQALISE